MRKRGVIAAWCACLCGVLFLAQGCGESPESGGQVSGPSIRLRVHRGEDGKISYVESLSGPLVLFTGGKKLTLRPVWSSK